jgi:hypothetical protein
MINTEIFKHKSKSDFDWLLDLEKQGLLILNFPAKLYGEKALLRFNIDCEKEDLKRNKEALKDRHECYDGLEEKIKINRNILNEFNSKLVRLNKEFEKVD